MEINAQPVPSSPSPRRGNEEKLNIDITKSNREHIERISRELVESRQNAAAQDNRTRADRIELSTEARLLLREATPQASDKHRARIEGLKQSFGEGSLNSSKRLERAAERMLGAE